MDAFEDNTFGGQPESDPAAEFLAREQDALAGLDDDLANPESVTQPGLLFSSIGAYFCFNSCTELSGRVCLAVTEAILFDLNFAYPDKRIGFPFAEVGKQMDCLVPPPAIAFVVVACLWITSSFGPK